MNPMSSQATLNNFVKEKRNTKPTPEHSEGWKLIKLESIAFIRKGTINPLDFPEEEFELYSIPAYHIKEKPEVKKGKEIKSSKVLVYPGDCLFGKLNPRVQKVWLVGPNNNKRQIATTEFFPIISKEKPNGKRWFLPEFLFFILKSPNIQERIIHKVLGTTASRQRLSPNDILEEEIPCPPLEEQRRVVARIQEIMSRIEQAKKLREEALEDTEAIMQSALHQTFSKVEEKGWEWKGLGEICNHVRYGLTAKSSRAPEGILFVRITDIDLNGNLKLTEPHHVKIDEETYEKYSIRMGDILIARSGATAGKVYLCNVEQKAVFASYLIRFRLKEDIVMPRFVFYFLQSPLYWMQLQISKVGGAQPNVNAQNLKCLRIPIPPLEQQVTIVAYLDNLREKFCTVKKYQEESQKEIEIMSQAVLRKAFSGKL